MSGKRKVEYQYWDAPGTGETYAIRITNGKVSGAVGPLHYTEIIAANLPTWPYDGEDAQLTAEDVRQAEREAEGKIIDRWTLHVRPDYTPED